jgi:DNA-binding GntR family transcriptional regulator
MRRSMSPMVSMPAATHCRSESAAVDDRQHEALVDAVESGDPNAAERGIVAHLERGCEFMRVVVGASATG